MGLTVCFTCIFHSYRNSLQDRTCHGFLAFFSWKVCWNVNSKQCDSLLSSYTSSAIFKMLLMAWWSSTSYHVTQTGKRVILCCSDKRFTNWETDIKINRHNWGRIVTTILNTSLQICCQLKRGWIKVKVTEETCYSSEGKHNWLSSCFSLRLGVFLASLEEEMASCLAKDLSCPVWHL